MKPQWSHGIGPKTMNICHSTMKMVSLNPDGKTGQEGMSIYAQTWSKMVSVELWVSFWRTKTKNRSINLATSTTIWMKVKCRRAHRLSLPNKLEVQGDYYILPKQLKYHLVSDPRAKYSQNTPKIISTDTYETTMIPRYWAWNYEYLSPHHENVFIKLGRENGTRRHVHLCTNLIQNGFSGVMGELLENQD